MSNKAEQNFKKFDHSKALGIHINRVNDLIATGLQRSEHNDFDLFFNQVIMSLMALDGMLDPFKDESFEEVFTDGDRFSSMRRGQQLKFVHEAIKKYTNLMYRKNLFYVQKSGRTNL